MTTTKAAGSSVTVRDAKLADVELVWGIGSGTREFRTSSNVVDFWPKAILQESIDSRDVSIKVAEIGERLIGFLIINLNRTLKKAEFENIYVLREYRDRGVGTQMVQETLKELKQQGIANVVTLQDEAAGYYEKIGFQKGRQFYWMDIVLHDSFARHNNEEEL